MSSPPAPAGDLPTTPPAQVELGTGTLSTGSTPGSVSGIVRNRDQFDADSGDDTTVESPHPKNPRTDESGTDGGDNDNAIDTSANDDPTALELLEELECGMCAGVFIDPVALNGCGHVFCGSCVQQWIKSIPRYPVSLLPGDPVPEPIACPHCRHSPIQTATPMPFTKKMVGILLSRMPSVARPANEHRQAKEIYTAGVLKFPIPPPPPRAPSSHEFWRPCKSCYPSEEGAWKCPTPVPRFDVPAERDRCVRADGIPPDGHRLCAGCERLSPCASPKSANCGICGEGFCGEQTSGCDCVAISQSKPTSMFNNFSNVLADCPSDMLALAFKDNWNEMTYLSNYIAQDESARDATKIYHAILEWLRTPEAKESGGLVGMMNRADINLRIRTGMADELQKAIMPVETGGTEAKICGGCVDEILCAGIIEWWMRELKKPEVANNRPANLKERPNCKFGRKCTRQENDRHAKKFNHICEPLPAEEAAALHQDDTMPATATETPSSEASDSDDEDKASYVDVSTQWDETPETETTLVVTVSEPINPKWLIAPERLTLTAPNAELSNPRVSIGSSASSPIQRTSSPHSAPRVSGSASTPLAGSFSWPNLPANLPPNATRPIGDTMPFGSNHSDTELMVSTGSKLSNTKSPSICVTLDDPNNLMFDASTPMDVDA